jgi:hypothetical protein
MAPVTSGIADGKENGLVFAACFIESRLAPGKPIDGIVGVLTKIRALLVNESVRVH